MRSNALLFILLACTSSAGDDVNAQETMDALAAARRSVAWETRSLPGRLEVVSLYGVSVPERVVFTAIHTSTEGIYRAGIVGPDGVNLDTTAALREVFDAWGYGPDRSVPPKQVAAVAAALIPGLHDKPAPLLDEGTRELLRPELLERVALPAEVEIDGQAGVQFWYSTASQPLTCQVVVRRSDGTVGYTSCPPE